MLAGHRWEYQGNWGCYKCVSLPIGGVESHQWCVGCGCVIDDVELCESGFPIDRGIELYLDLLATRKGFKPVEAGTLS